jgi:ABC-type xylose transport system substrate-binding protein
LSRRNLTPEDKTYLIGIQYKLEKKEVGGQLPRKGGDQNEPALRTAEKVAKQHHVSPDTVKRAEKFADAVDKLSPEEKAEVLAGKSGKTKQEIIESLNPKPEPEL